MPYPLDVLRIGNFRPMIPTPAVCCRPSVDEWLAEQHLARFVIEVVAGLDLRAVTGNYVARARRPTNRNGCRA